MTIHILLAVQNTKNCTAMAPGRLVELTVHRQSNLMHQICQFIVHITLKIHLLINSIHQAENLMHQICQFIVQITLKVDLLINSIQQAKIIRQISAVKLSCRKTIA